MNWRQTQDTEHQLIGKRKESKLLKLSESIIIQVLVTCFLTFELRNGGVLDNLISWCVQQPGKSSWSVCPHFLCFTELLETT